MTGVFLFWPLDTNVPKYAAYDSSVPAPSPVTGWYDTDLFNYPNPPKSWLEMSDIQWQNRMSGHWAVQNNSLVPYTPPAPPEPTLIEDPYQVLEKRIAALEAKLADKD
jgi:hypothetical protein